MFLYRYLGEADMAVVAARFPERQVFAEDALADLPPFTNLARGTTEFQARLLDQAAVDNFDIVGKFLQGDATAEQLDELFTSCFMHECLRDELFIAIYKNAGPSIEGNDKACQLVQLALGHFGPSEKLHYFVYSLVGHCDEGLKLVELLFRRQYVWVRRTCVTCSLCCERCPLLPHASSGKRIDPFVTYYRCYGPAGNEPWTHGSGETAKCVCTVPVGAGLTVSSRMFTCHASYAPHNRIVPILHAFCHREVCDEVLQRIKDTFHKFNAPKYTDEEWSKAISAAYQVLHPST
jgi:hypothetical protein